MSMMASTGTRFSELAKEYRSALLDDVIPLGEKHSVDRACGGFFSCLDRDGSVYDTDKFVWLQGRQVWTFSMLHNLFKRRDSWLQIARHGAEFLTRHGSDRERNWYFSLTRDGRPLVQPYNVFSDCFAAIAFGQFARATATRAYNNILARRGNPKGKYSKTVPGTRPMISLALPMILANVPQELEGLLDPGTFAHTLDVFIEEVFSLFLNEKTQVLREHVAPDGRELDCFEGRLINPGHGTEAMWFIMDVAERRKDRARVERAVDVVLRTLELGWDDKFRGIFYFLDAQGYPPQQLEWDQKLWRVHVETLVAPLKGYRLTGRQSCWSWFERVHAYTWTHFPDPEFGNGMGI